MNDQSRNINDLSTGGCFVSEPDLGLNVGEKVFLSFKGADLTIACKGEVMRRTPGGYGIRFMSLPAVERRDIRRMLKARFTLRYEIELPGRIVWVNRTRIHEKPLGFGVNFKSSQRRLMRVIIERYGKGKLTR